VLVKGVRKNLFDRETGFLFEVLDHQVVTFIGDPMGVLGQVGIGDDVGVFLHGHFGLLGKVYLNRRFIPRTGVKREEPKHAAGQE
jgi:hypothetical protein